MQKRMGRKPHETIDLRNWQKWEVIPNGVIIFSLGNERQKRGEVKFDEQFIKEAGKMFAYYLQANPVLTDRIKNQKNKRITRNENGEHEQKSGDLRSI